MNGWRCLGRLHCNEMSEFIFDPHHLQLMNLPSQSSVLVRSEQAKNKRRRRRTEKHTREDKKTQLNKNPSFSFSFLSRVSSVYILYYLLLLFLLLFSNFFFHLLSFVVVIVVFVIVVAVDGVYIGAFSSLKIFLSSHRSFRSVGRWFVRLLSYFFFSLFLLSILLFHMNTFFSVSTLGFLWYLRQRQRQQQLVVEMKKQRSREKKTRQAKRRKMSLPFRLESCGMCVCSAPPQLLFAHFALLLVIIPTYSTSSSFSSAFLYVIHISLFILATVSYERERRDDTDTGDGGRDGIRVWNSPCRFKYTKVYYERFMNVESCVCVCR